MRFYDISFFVDEDKGVLAKIDVKSEDIEDKWAVTLFINPSGSRPDKPSITIWMSVKQFQLFAESVRSADQKLHEELASHE